MWHLYDSQGNIVGLIQGNTTSKFGTLTNNDNQLRGEISLFDRYVSGI